MTSATKRRPFILLGILCLIVGFVIGILIGHFTASGGNGKGTSSGQTGQREEDESISEKLMAVIDKERIRENLR